MGDVVEAVEPLSMTVRIGDMRETDLMAALEQVVEHWQQRLPHADPQSVARSVRWLHDKYTTPPQQALQGGGA